MSEHCLPPQWIPVTDFLPEPCADVLIALPEFMGDKTPCVELGFYRRGQWYLTGECELREVTHWMPLPEPPK